MKVYFIFAGFFVSSFVTSIVLADTWAGFRGNTGSSVSTERNVPLKWSIGQGVMWETPLPGESNSSPAITNNRVYVTTFDPTDASLIVLSLDRFNGKILWQKTVGRGEFFAYGPPELFRYRHNPATPSPCADENDNVYAFFGTGDLVSLDREGNIRWQKNLADIYGPYDLKFGMGSSPRFWQNRVYISCIHKGPSYAVALDAATGDEVWLTNRNYNCLGDATDAYTSPAILHVAGLPPQLVLSGATHVDAYDLETGERIWENGDLVLEDEEYGRTIASPAVGEGMVVAPSAKAKLAISVKAERKGTVVKNPKSRVLNVQVDCPSPTIYEGRIYSVKDDGVGNCLDLKTGKEYWKSRMGGERYQASPVAAGGKVYFLSIEGKCTVVDAGNKIGEKIENEIPGVFYATPAISNGVIFLRDRSRVIAVGSQTISASIAAEPPKRPTFDFQPDPAFPQWPDHIKKGRVSGVAADGSGRIMALQRENPPIVVFDAAGKFVISFGDDLFGDASQGAHGISVDAENNIWTTDSLRHVVYQFSPQGKLLRMLGTADQPSDNLDSFNRPTFVTFGRKNDFYVTDGYGNSRVVHYLNGAKYPEAWGKAGSGPGEFNKPHSGIVDARGRLVVCDLDNYRIQVLDAQTGQHLETWNGYKPFGIAADHEGNIFISDGLTSQIVQLDSQGKKVRSWGKVGTAPGEFEGMAHLIAADKDGNLYSAELKGQRIQKFKRVSSH